MNIPSEIHVNFESVFDTTFCIKTVPRLYRYAQWLCLVHEIIDKYKIVRWEVYNIYLCRDQMCWNFGEYERRGSEFQSCEKNRLEPKSTIVASSGAIRLFRVWYRWQWALITDTSYGNTIYSRQNPAGTVTYFVTPTILPGISRNSGFVHAMNAACGPPYPRGVPSRWLLPTTMSAPYSPGAFNSVSDNRSVAHTTRACKHTRARIDKISLKIQFVLFTKCPRIRDTFKFLITECVHRELLFTVLQIREFKKHWFWKKSISFFVSAVVVKVVKPNRRFRTFDGSWTAPEAQTISN